jgi:hypothetical protein
MFVEPPPSKASVVESTFAEAAFVEPALPKSRIGLGVSGHTSPFPGFIHEPIIPASSAVATAAGERSGRRP